MDRRTTLRSYDALLPEYFPVKLLGDAIAVDFVVGCPTSADPCAALDTRVPPRRVLAWLRSMPSYRAGVPVCLGHATDAGLAFGKCAELIELLDRDRPITYRTGRALAPHARAFFAAPRSNLLLELTVTPRSTALGVVADPLQLVRSAEGLDRRSVHWLVGPLAVDSEREAARILQALPRGSRLTLVPAPAGATPAGAGALARLEEHAHALGHTVSEWTCRSALARVGKGFSQVDRLTGQADLARRAHDLITCATCPSRTQCHGTLDQAALLARLDRELGVLGLSAAAAPVRTGPRAFRIELEAPAAPGDEAYLSHALGQPVAITLSSRAPRARQDGAAGGVSAAVLRRWYATGFLPVTELNAAAEKVLEDLARRQGASGQGLPLASGGAAS